MDVEIDDDMITLLAELQSTPSEDKDEDWIKKNYKELFGGKHDGILSEDDLQSMRKDIDRYVATKLSQRLILDQQAAETSLYTISGETLQEILFDQGAHAT